jgi:hypothetical protein
VVDHGRVRDVDGGLAPEQENGINGIGTNRWHAALGRAVRPA